jgi:hypothetical protein
MPLSYQNRYQQTYYFKKVPTEKGHFRYYTTKTITDNCIDDLPRGYEFYEHPEYAIVFLRKKIPLFLEEQEISTVHKAITELAHIKDFVVEARGRKIQVFITDINADFLEQNFQDIVEKSSKTVTELLQQVQRFDLRLIFVLEHPLLRIFRVQKCSFAGFQKRWIDLEKSNDIAYLAQKYCFHLGRDTYYKLKPVK